MAKNAMALIFDLIATDSASPVFNRIAASADRAAVATNRASSSTAGFSRKMVGAFGAIAAIDIGVHAVKAAADFQRAMLLIQTQAGRSSADVKTMSSAVLGMAGSVGTAPLQLADALYHITSTGLPAAKTLEVLKIAAIGAKVGNADLVETTNALTSAVVSGIPGVQDMAQAMGGLNAIVGAGDMKMSDLNEALGTGILSKMSGYGLSLADVGAALATFGDLNIRGANAATDLRMAVEAFARPAGAKALEKIGISATKLRDDMQKGGLNKAVLDLNDHLKAAGITGNKVGGYLLDAFSKKGASGVALLMSSLGLFESKYPRYKAGAEGIGAAWAATTKTASFAFDRIKASMDAFMITVGTAVLPAVTKMFSGIGVVAQALQGTLGKLTLIVLGAWAAFRLLSGAASIMQTIALKAMYAKDAVVGLQTSALGLGATLAITAAAAAVIVVGLNAFADAHRTVAASADDSAKTLTQFNKTGDLTSGMLKTLGVSSGHLGSVMENTFHESTMTKIKDFKFGLDGIIHSPFNSATDDAGNFFKSVNGGLKQMLSNGDLAGARNVISSLAVRSGVSVDKLESKMPGLKAAFADAATSIGGMTKAQAAAIVHTAMLDKTQSASMTLLGDLANQYGLTSKQAQGYADLVGLTADRINSGQVSTKALAAGVRDVSTAYDTATQAGSAYLAALQTFSTSAGTSADRAAMIGATLKAANGDALGFAGAMNAAAVANGNFASAISQASGADQIKGINAKAAANKKYLDSVVVLTDRTVNLGTKTDKAMVTMTAGSIDFTKSGAAPLITALDGIQSSALTAAQSLYQHEIATKGGKRAADDAYGFYVRNTRGSLIDQATKLGLAGGQAKLLADKYFGMPKDVKTKIEQIGADPVLQTLNELGTQLAHLTHVPWVTTIVANTDSALNAVENFRIAIGEIPSDKYVTVHTVAGAGTGDGSLIRRASGGVLRGPGTGTSDSILVAASNDEFIVNAKQSRKHRRLLHAINQGAQGFAGGGVVSAGSVLSYLLAHGFSRNAAAGILGNIKIESGFNTNAYNAREGAHGFFQDEGGRWIALQAYARAHRLSPNSAQAQLGYALQEMSGMGGFKGQLNRSSAGGAAALFDAQFERSSGAARGARMAAANSFAHLKASAGSLGAGGGSVASTLSSTVGTAIGNVGNAPAGPKFDVATLGIGLINTQIRAAWRTLNAEIHKGLSHAASAAFVRQLHGFTALAARQLGALKNVIRGHDAGTLTNATLTGTRADVVTATEQMALDARRAGASLRAVANIRHGEQGLLAIQAKRLDMTNRIAAAQTKLADMTTTGDAMKSTLAGNFDTTKYGSVTDLLGGLGSATDTNSKFAQQIAQLSKSGLNKNYLSQLAASGPSATLDTLAGASKSEIGQVNKAVGAYTSSLQAGSDAAVLQRYGVSTATQTKAIGELTTQLKTQASHAGELVAVLAQVATRPWQVTIDGKAIAHAVLDDKQFEHVLAELRNHLHYGGHR